MASKVVAAMFENDDLQLLEGCVERERLKKSDILRRAVRHYAEHLGVKSRRGRRKK